MSASIRLQQCHQIGLALVGVLWLVAALSLTALALARTVRTETQAVAYAGQALAAQAFADAGLHLAMQTLKLKPTGINEIQRTVHTFQERRVVVELAPLTGWIDINRAPESLLSSAFEKLANVEASRAAKLATDLVQLRQRPKETEVEPKVFASVEDLMRLPGWDIEIWSSVAPFLTANNGGSSGGVNPLAAPLPVLYVLAQGNVALAERIYQKALTGEPAIDTSGLQMEWTNLQGSRLLQVSVRSEAADGSQLTVKRRVDLSGKPDDGLSWRIIHESVGVESARPDPGQTKP